MLFDGTSTSFDDDGRGRLGSFSFSHEPRVDLPRANLALVTRRVGLPFGHWLYSGTKSNIRSMAEALREFRDRLGHPCSWWSSTVA